MVETISSPFICAFFLSLAVRSYAAEPGDLERLAELPIEELPKIKVTTIASGSAKPVPQAPAIASVITQEEIAAMGVASVDDVLDTIPGVHASHSGQVYSARVTIRGIGTTFSPQVLFMVNGIQVKNVPRGGRGTVAFIDIPVAFISRIEVIRGPGSAQYGADAFSGVINIITKTANELRGTEVGGGAGSFTTKKAWLLHGEAAGDLSLSLMANYFSTEGHQRIIERDLIGQSGPPSLSHDDVHLQMNLTSRRWTLHGIYSSRQNVGVGQGVAEALSPSSRFSGTWALLDFTYRMPEIWRDWDITSQFSISQESQEMQSNNILFPAGSDFGRGVFTDPVIGNPEIWSREARFNTWGIYQGFANHRIRLGAGATSENIYKVRDSLNFTPDLAPRGTMVNVSGTSEAFLPEVVRNSYFVYTQDEWKLAKAWELTVGARFDDYEDFDGTFNPRAALVWTTTPQLTTKFLYGRAFRAPAFTELYVLNNPAFLGNPNLKPETIDVYEIGFSHQTTANWNSSLNLYHYDLHGLIDFVRDPAPATTRRAQNATDIDDNGFEIETQFKTAQRLSLTGHYAYTWPLIRDLDVNAGNAPTHKIYAREEWSPFQNWNFNSQVTWVGARPRQPQDPRDPLAGYTSVDLIIKRTAFLNARLQITGTVRNIFDADIREPSPGPNPISRRISIPNDLPQAGRSVFVEASLQF